MNSPRFALLTPSYRGDFERCRLLCASVDRFVTSLSTHYLLVDDRDVAMFRALEGPRRRVISERELLPSWLPSWPDPMSRGRRRIWTGPGALVRGVMPLRGWHIQQLMKLSVPMLIDDEILLYADSDVVFLKPYDLASQISDGRVRLFRKPCGVTTSMANHVAWSRRAATALGLPEPTFPADDYVNNLVSWSNANVRKLHAHIEAVSGRHWISAVTAGRGFSEWIIYGQFVHDVLGASSGHAESASELVKTYWFEHEVDLAALAPGRLAMEGGEVALGVQSFIGVSVEQLWGVFRSFADRA
jgi:Family of unknown function (DUF6492)